MCKRYLIGLDFGTDSVRSVIVEAGNGREISTAVSDYYRWKMGLYSDPSKNQFRHHPDDYIESLTQVVKEVLRLAPKNIKDNIIGIGIDTTGSTPAPVDARGTALSMKDEFSKDPDAMFILWKDHTAVKEADKINQTARTWNDIDYTRYSGGVYSSEWFFSKILYVLRHNKKVRDSAHA